MLFVKSGLRRRLLQAVCLFIYMPAVSMGAAGAQDIGTVALAVAKVTGTPPQSAPRALGQGARVVQNETVATGARARAELLFLDQTSVSLGENTVVVLDRFVFDPGKGSSSGLGAGDMALTLTRGVLRFIGGALSDGQPATLRTPTAAIGIRGSSALVSATARQTQVVFVAGNQLCLTPNGGAPVCTSVIGGVLTDDGFIGQIDAAILAALLGAIDQVSAAGGGISSLDGLDLAQLVPLDVVPFSTGGAQSDQGNTPLDASIFGGPPSDGETEIETIETTKVTTDLPVPTVPEMPIGTPDDPNDSGAGGTDPGADGLGGGGDDPPICPTSPC